MDIKHLEGGTYIWDDKTELWNRLRLKDVKQAIQAYVDKQVREAYKKGYINGGLDEFMRHEDARKKVEDELSNNKREVSDD